MLFVSGSYKNRQNGVVSNQLIAVARGEIIGQRSAKIDDISFSPHGGECVGGVIESVDVRLCARHSLICL